MRILLLSPHVPTPVKRRTLNAVRHLARRHELHLRILVAPHEARAEAARLDALRAACASLAVLPIPLPRRLLAALRDWTAGADLRAAYMRAHEAWLPSLRSDCERLAIDVVHADRARTTRLAARLERPLVVDLPDCLSFSMEQWAARARGARAALYRADARRLRAFEGGTLNAAPVVGVASDEEGARLRAAGYRGAVRYLPGIIDLGDDPLAPVAAPAAPRLVFHGTLSYQPNVDAITSFVRGPWPSLRRRFPRLELWIVGAHATRAVRRLHGAGVRVVGAVDHVAPWLRGATAVIVPLRLAVGHSQKACEALLTGRPVICSPPVVACVDPTVRPFLRSAGTAAEWIAAVAALLDDPARALADAAAGGRAVEACYGAAAVLPRLEEAYAVAQGRWAPDGARR